MRRYTDQLARAYREAGFTVDVRRPRDSMSRRARLGPARKLLAYVEQLVLFPLLVGRRTRHNDLVHIADHSDAPWLLLGIRSRATIVTCHDLIAVRAALGEFAEVRIRRTGRIYQRLVRAGLARANTISTVSHATAADVRRLVPGPALETSHNAVLPGAVGSAPKGTPPYVLVVSTAGWRKRREFAIEVWLRLRDSWPGESLKLRIVGPPLTTLERSKLESGSEGDVDIEWDVSEERLAELYSGAVALLQVSKYEGFGWPIVEANVHGVPAICTSDAVFREVAGVAAYLLSDELDDVDWTAVAAWAQSSQSRANATINSERFKWSDFVTRTSLIASRTLDV